jgi:Spy/CpxP family protein refolding chaperone
MGYGHHHGAWGGPGAGAGRGPGAGAGRGPGAGLSPEARAEGRLAAVKTELKITAAQESAWQTFATKAKSQAQAMQAQRAKMIEQAQAAVPAPERLAQRTEVARQRAANMEAMTGAVKDLYAVLTPEQKTVADQLLARGPGAGGPGGHGGRGFRG